MPKTGHPKFGCIIVWILDANCCLKSKLDQSGRDLCIGLHLDWPFTVQIRTELLAPKSKLVLDFGASLYSSKLKDFYNCDCVHFLSLKCFEIVVAHASQRSSV